MFKFKGEITFLFLFLSLEMKNLGCEGDGGDDREQKNGERS